MANGSRLTLEDLAAFIEIGADIYEHDDDNAGAIGLLRMAARRMREAAPATKGLPMLRAELSSSLRARVTSTMAALIATNETRPGGLSQQELGLLQALRDLLPDHEPER